MIDTYCICCINYPITIQKRCAIWISCAQSLSNNQTKKYEHDKKHFWIKVKYFKNFEIVLEILLYEKKEYI